jgi:hypothetical protein
MIRVVKFYKPVILDPGQSEEWIVEDTMQGAKFVFLPYFRLYNKQGNGDVNLTITHFFDLGWGDDPLWSGVEQYELVNDLVPGNAIRDYTFTPQLDKDPNIKTYHKVKLENPSTATDTYVYKTLVFGLSETQVQTSGGSGVITTRLSQ